MIALKGDKEIGDKINKIIDRLAEVNYLKGVIDQADFNDTRTSLAVARRCRIASLSSWQFLMASIFVPTVRKTMTCRAMPMST